MSMNGHFNQGSGWNFTIFEIIWIAIPWFCASNFLLFCRIISEDFVWFSDFRCDEREREKMTINSLSFIFMFWKEMIWNGVVLNFYGNETRPSGGKVVMALIWHQSSNSIFIFNRNLKNFLFKWTIFFRKIISTAQSGHHYTVVLTPRASHVILEIHFLTATTRTSFYGPVKNDHFPCYGLQLCIRLISISPFFSWTADNTVSIYCRY